MAILKIISHGKTNKAKMQLLKYILNPQKTNEELCYVTGDYQLENITPTNVYQEFQRVRTLFGKDKMTNNRTYTHGTIAFAQGELNPDGVGEFVNQFVAKAYPKHQALVAVHTDTEHPHAHFVLEPVSFVDGKMLHTSKKDLEKAKILCNEMCLERSLHVPEKGYHYDGKRFDVGVVTAWNKEKYHMLAESEKKSYLVDLAHSVEMCLKIAKSRNEFCCLLENEFGWSAIWKEGKKNITFVDAMERFNYSKNIEYKFQELTR